MSASRMSREVATPSVGLRSAWGGLGRDLIRPTVRTTEPGLQRSPAPEPVPDHSFHDGYRQVEPVEDRAPYHDPQAGLSRGGAAPPRARGAGDARGSGGARRLLHRPPRRRGRGRRQKRRRRRGPAPGGGEQARELQGRLRGRPQSRLQGDVQEGLQDRLRHGEGHREAGRRDRGRHAATRCSASAWAALRPRRARTPRRPASAKAEAYAEAKQAATTRAASEVSARAARRAAGTATPPASARGSRPVRATPAPQPEPPPTRRPAPPKDRPDRAGPPARPGQQLRHGHARRQHSRGPGRDPEQPRLPGQPRHRRATAARCSADGASAQAARPAPAPDGGFILQPARWVDWNRHRYGDLVTFRTLFDPCFVMVFEPELVKRVFRGKPTSLRAGEANWVLGPMLGDRRCCCSTAPSTCAAQLLLPPFHGERMRDYEQVCASATVPSTPGRACGRSRSCTRCSRSRST